MADMFNNSKICILFMWMWIPLRFPLSKLLSFALYINNNIAYIDKLDIHVTTIFSLSELVLL